MKCDAILTNTFEIILKMELSTFLISGFLGEKYIKHQLFKKYRKARITKKQNVLSKQVKHQYKNQQ